jgi:hypothetical protein
MKSKLIAAAAALAVSGSALNLPLDVANAAPGSRAEVSLTIKDARGRQQALSALPRADQARIASLRESLQNWGDGQQQRVKITVSCSYPPLTCTITIRF